MEALFITDVPITVEGYLAQLDDENTVAKVNGLKKLNKKGVVGSHWFEIAHTHLQTLEILVGDQNFPEAKLAALIVSKVYFEMEKFELSIEMALKAGELFDKDHYSLYVKTINSKAIELYMQLRKHNFEAKDESAKKSIDDRLEQLIKRSFDCCLTSKNYELAVGMAVEFYRIDLIEKTFSAAPEDRQPALLAYCKKIVVSFVQNRKQQQEILRCLVQNYSKMQKPDHINVCQCLLYLDDWDGVAKTLENLVKESSHSTLKAYQIAFDLYESATQQFVANVLRVLQALKSQLTSSSTTNEDLAKKLDTLIKILSGDETVKLHLQFAIKNNKTDMLILKGMKDVVRSSVIHSAVVVTNGFMHTGTTCDDFLRDNLEWVGKASNWAKFTAVASLGVIHKGHESDAMKLLDPYLPKENQAGSTGYLEGGSLYALGMIHANHGNEKIIDYLKNQLTDARADSFNVKHGACLGLGLAAMGTHKEDIYNILKNAMYSDDAVLGEAATIAMGLVMLGSKSSEVIKDMTTYASETQHEKTLRGLCIGISLLTYGRLEEATTLVETLSMDKDPNMRRCAIYTLAMAYCGSNSKSAINRLLNVSVSDADDDVRRAAATCLGFLLCKTPEQCPPMVSLLAESYNPHVRYGAAMALGIACAGSANKEALALLDPMLNDAVSYVRQGAMIAVAMILMQHNEASSSKVKEFRTMLTKVTGDKHEESMTKFGAIVAQGILDAAGRNATISLQTRSGHIDAASVVGVLTFLQYWFWFPLTHFLALAFRPTCLIALDGDLKMPKVEFRSNAKPSLFAYPPALEEKKEKTAEKVETAVLSITAKQKKKEKERQQGRKSSSLEKMEVDETPGKEKDKDATETQLSTGSKHDEKKSEPEPNFQILNNPARVLNAQLKYISFTDSKYKPLKSIIEGGIIMLEDTDPSKPADFVELTKGGGSKAAEDDREAPPPEPFEYTVSK